MMEEGICFIHVAFKEFTDFNIFISLLQYLEQFMYFEFLCNLCQLRMNLPEKYVIFGAYVLYM